MITETPLYISTEQAQKRWGISDLPRRRIRGDSPPFVKLDDGKKNSKVLYNVTEGDAWLAARTKRCTSEYAASHTRPNDGPGPLKAA